MKVVIPAKGARMRKYPDGNIYQGFGENKALYEKAVCLQNCIIDKCCLEGHNGIDIAMQAGTPIIGTAGIVVDVKNDVGGYGKHIRILTDPNENNECLELTYGHLKDISCPIGMRIKDGDQIGTMGNTGFIVSGSTPYWGNAPAGKGVHLHFGVRSVSIKDDTGWQSVYATGQRVFIRDYQNGFFGSVDPLPFIQEWIDDQLSMIQIAINKIREVITNLKRSREIIMSPSV